MQDDGSIVCWGANDYGKNLNGRRDAVRPPDGDFVSIALDQEASCALDRAGQIQCWGWYFDPENYYEVTPPAGEFVALSVSSYAVHLRGGPPHGACGLSAQGTVECTEGSEEGTFVSGSVEGSFVSLSSHGGISAVHEAVWWQGDSPDGRFEQLAAGPEHACGIRSGGSVECWGGNDAGQATPPSGTFTQVSVGTRHSCGIRTGGELACWGDPELTSAPSGAFAQVATGAEHSCALDLDDKVACWGTGSGFELFPPWELAADPRRYVSVAVGGDALYLTEMGYWENGRPTGCALTIDAEVECFGDELGEPPEGLFEQVSVGYGVACAIRTDGGLACWGDSTLSPADPPTETYARVSVGHYHACAVRRSGEVDCWRLPEFDELPSPAGLFLEVSLNASWVEEVDPFNYELRACALTPTGDALCWLTGAPTTTETVPGPFVQIATGVFGACALAESGSVECWGRDARSDPLPPTLDGVYSEIGFGRSPMALPVSGVLPGLDGEVFEQLAVGGDYACGLRSDGRLRCFGTRVR